MQPAAESYNVACIMKQAQNFHSYQVSKIAFEKSVVLHVHGCPAKLAE